MADCKNIVIFDGVCNLCNTGVNFLIARDRKKQFCFVPMQSEVAQDLVKQYRPSGFDYESFLLIKNGECYDRSDAALEVAKELGGIWSWTRVFTLVPKPVRDVLYDLVAKHRYKIFGKRDQCMVPRQDIKDRFIES